MLKSKSPTACRQLFYVNASTTSRLRPAVRFFVVVFILLLTSSLFTQARGQGTIKLSGTVLVSTGVDWIPIQGATVTVRKEIYCGPREGEVSYQQTTSGADGYYEFNVEPFYSCVVYDIVPVMPGYVGTGPSPSGGVYSDMDDLVCRLSGGDKMDDAGDPSCKGKGIGKGVGMPVNVTNGNMYIQQTDYILPGVGASLQISRSYNSVSTRVGLFGMGWSTLYDEAVVASDANLVRLYEPDGRATYFMRTGGVGAFTPFNSDVRAQLVKNGDGSYTLTFKDSSVHQFNAAGKLLWLKDRNNNQMTLTYDTNGKLTTITDLFGRAVSVGTNTNGQVLTISDTAGTIATYAYTGSFLDSVVYGDSSRFDFHYYGGNRPVIESVTDALSHVVESHEYDIYGRALTSRRHGGVEEYTLDYLENGETDVTDARSKVTKYFYRGNRGRYVVTKVEGVCGCGSGGGQTQSMTYDDELNVLTKTNALNQTTTYTYDSQGNRLTSTDALGTTTCTYNSFGEVLTVTDSMNGVTTITYDTHGNPLTITDALNQTTTLTYNTHGQVLTATDARGKVTTFLYDTSGNLQRVTDALNQQTNFAYDGRGRLTSVTDALNQTTAYEYDLAGRLKKITRPDASVITATYDLAGRRTQSTDPLNHTITFAYDGANRLTSVTDAATHVTSYGYDLMSNVTSRTDALGHVTDYEYDDFNRLKKIIYPAATVGATRLTELVGYDAGGNVTSRTDTAGRVTNYEYDAAQRLKKVTDALSQVTEYQYNARSQMTEVKDALNQQYSFTYDALGRVTQQTRGGHSMSLAYDAVGNRTSRTDYNGQTTTYAFDNLNRLTTITYPNTTTATYGYDALSRLTSAANSAGTVTFAYDEMSRVSSTTDVFGQEITYAYDAAGNRLTLNREHQSVSYSYDSLNRLTEVGDSTGTATFTYTALNQPETRTLPNGVITTYQYNGLSQLTQLQERRGATTFITRQYGYNTAGQINQLTESETTQGTSSHTYGYDEVNRLRTATHTNQPAESYTYDAVGNRTASHNESSYQYDPFNQLVETANLWSYSYDFNGNQLSKLDGGGHYDEWHYTWDFENRLTQAQLPFGESVSYQYDALGRRVQRSSTVSGETTQYTYDGQEVILDTNSDGNTVEYLNGPGVDNKLAVNHSQWGVFYLLHDQLGSTRVVTDATGGAIDHAAYDSFGSGTVSGVTRYAYTGREWDEDAGLYYYRARWYDQQQGRFISEDPIGLNGGINLYGYVGNNPLNFIDPTGTEQRAWYPGEPEAFEGLRQQMARWPPSKDCECSSSGTNMFLMAGAIALWDGPEPGPADVVAGGYLISRLLVGSAVVAAGASEATRPNYATYYHYSTTPPERFGNFLWSGSSCTTIAGLDSKTASGGLGIPPPLFMYPIIVDPSITPVQNMGPVAPNRYGPGGLPDIYFPQGAPPGSIGPPVPVLQTH